jgi:predicted regulator of amino acid metabolism with ACT domain
MWHEILDHFSDSPSQAMVVSFLAANGFGVTLSGKIACNGIPVAATQVAQKVGVDRRVVDMTVHRILNNPELASIFLNMRATPDISLIAEYLGLYPITILPKNAAEEGIIGATLAILSAERIPLRQIFVTDPYLSETPKLVIVAEKPIPAQVIHALRDLPSIKTIIL